ncbi:MAG TPA: GNAT family N-acetyltransferase [Eubacteriales bacterium]|nr:GNAT family N-acetyltransferase [Eubacteriales bacterium]
MPAEKAYHIEPITERNIAEAANVHAASWRESHKAICTPEFIALHTASRQAEYLANEMQKGKRLFLLRAARPVGIVSVQGSLIENLYVLPDEQRKGYGTALLDYAIGQCSGVPTLGVLCTNQNARALYLRRGFVETGKKIKYSETLFELEMRLETVKKPIF